MKEITQQQAENYISLDENHTDNDDAVFYTKTTLDDGWDEVVYYTGRKKNMFSGKGEGDQWVYILSDPTRNHLLKIGYTKRSPEDRANEISHATGMPLPLKVEYKFKCFNGENLEGEVHHKLADSRVSNNKEWFNIELDEAIKTVTELGENYKN